MYRLVFRAAGAVVGGRFAAELRKLEAVEWLSLEEVQAFTEARLAPLLRHAVEHVPFYRETYQRLGLAPGDLRTIADLARLPIVSKGLIRSHGEERFLAENMPPDRRILDRTSGSTGEPFRFYRDREGMARSVTGRVWFDTWFGLRPFDRSVRLRSPRPIVYPAPSGSPTVSRLRRAALARLKAWYDTRTQCQFTLPQIDAAQAEAVYRCIEAFGPDYVTSYSSTLATLADELQDRGLRLTLPLRAVVVGAETLTPLRQQRIEEYFEAPIINRYGLRELGFYMAQNCPASSDRFHVHPERAVWETVREDGTQAAPGEVGRVVVTALDNFVMPFIRYETGDLAVAGGEPCPCGRGLPLVGPVDGRIVECLRTPSGKTISTMSVIPRVVPDASYVDVVRQYQLVQEAPDRVRLLVVPAGAVDDRWDRIRANLEDLFGEEVTVVMERVTEIPCEPSGKRLMVKSLCSSAIGPSEDTRGCLTVREGESP